MASFEKEDAERLLFFCTREGKNGNFDNLRVTSPPSWLRPPPPSRKRSSIYRERAPTSLNGQFLIKKEDSEKKEARLSNGIRTKTKSAALRPIPHVRHQKMLPFSRVLDADVHDGGPVKANLPAPPAKHSAGTTQVTNRKSTAGSYQAKQVISLNPLPLKKHGCGRSPLHVCSEVSLFSLIYVFLYCPTVIVSLSFSFWVM